MRTFVAVLLLSSGCYAGILRGSGHVVTERREVAEFDGVDVGAAIRVTVEIGPRGPIEVRADDNVLPLVETSVEGGRLHIGMKPVVGFKGETEIEVHVRAPAIRYLGASGAAEIVADVQRGDGLEIEASGAARVRVKGIDVAQLDASGSGGSEIELTGAAQKANLEMSGATRVVAAKLEAREVSVQASGGSRGQVRASDTIRGQVSGASNLRVFGKAAARVKTSGASSIDYEE